MMVRNVALLGHKDHGKSTLIGSLLMQTGAATKVRIKEAEAYSKRLHKSFEPAFILDSFAEERLKGMTIDTTRAEINHKGTAFMLIDVPGHEELIKNMISGASYGEVAVLLVSAKPGEGIRAQTKRHLFIAHMLGMDRLIVAVNKMDTVGYEKDAFMAVERDLSAFAARVGFERRNVRFVPISAYIGENLVKPSRRMPWYSGKPLLDTLYESAKPARHRKGSLLRVLLQGTIPIGGKAFAAGRVLSGSISVGDDVVMLPSDRRAKISSIIIRGRHAKTGKAGENIAVLLDKPINEEVRGSVLAGAGGSLKAAGKVKALVFVARVFGRRMHLKFNGVEVQCKKVKVLRNIDSTTGEAYGPTSPKPLDVIEAELTLEHAVPMESYSATHELGRFVLYSGNEFAGMGVVQ